MHRRRLCQRRCQQLLHGLCPRILIFACARQQHSIADKGAHLLIDPVLVLLRADAGAAGQHQQRRGRQGERDRELALCRHRRCPPMFMCSFPPEDAFPASPVPAGTPVMISLA